MAPSARSPAPTFTHELLFCCPDCAGTVMYADLVLAPWVRQLRERGRLLHEQRPVYVWDNFAAHHVQVVKDAFEAAGVDIMTLLPNTTDILQVMDLVVNGPGKSFLRSARVR